MHTNPREEENMVKNPISFYFYKLEPYKETTIPLLEAVQQQENFMG